MNIKNEITLINTIRYTPAAFILIVSFIITSLFLDQKEKNFEDDIKKIELNYYDTNRARVKEEIVRVYNFIVKEKSKSTELLQSSIKQRVDEIHKTITYLYDDIKKKQGEKEALRVIKNTLRQIRFNEGRGYFFMYGMDGTALMHPILSHLEGKNLIDYKDAKGTRIFKEMSQILKNKNETFYEWYWYKPGIGKKQYKKIGYFKKFEPLGAYIATGEYLDEFEESLKKRIIQRVQNIKYKKRGYVFLFDTDGVCLAHRDPSFVGQNRLNIKNKDNIYVARDLVNFVKDKDEGFMTYFSSYNTDKSATSNKKISFIKKYGEWNWILGTGFYTQALNKTIALKKEQLLKQKEENIRQITLTSMILTALLLIISFMVSRSVEKMFKGYKKQIESEIKENQLKESILMQQSKMATMGEMIANITHQWKQPLSYISTASSGIKLEHEYETLNDKKLIEGISGIERSVDYLSQTIDDFKDFFNPQNKVERFFLSSVIESSLHLMGSQFLKNKIEVIKNIEDIDTCGTKNLLLQVIINILKNSEDALLGNSIDEKRYIFIDVHTQSEKIYIVIKDNAKGIDKDIISKVFDPYFTTKGKNGTGIGLYMSKVIIEDQMKGIIELKNIDFVYENKDQRGVEFIITLPLAK